MSRELTDDEIEAVVQAGRRAIGYSTPPVSESVPEQRPGLPDRLMTAKAIAFRERAEARRRAALAERLRELPAGDEALLPPFRANRAAPKDEPLTPPRRQRKPSIATQIKRAEKAGKSVTSITTTEGVTLHFGEADTGKTGNELDEWLKKHAH